MKLPVYMDNNSTTQMDPAVFEAMTPWFVEKFGNASSKDHSYGWEANSAVENARKQVADLINADPSEIIFTAGATESINLSHFGIVGTYYKKGKRIITTAIEHSAVLDSLKSLEQKGFEVIYLEVDSNGLIDLNSLMELVTNDTLLVSVMTANNEIGVINDIASIGEICRAKEVFFHTDATQAVGKIPIDLKNMNVDLLSFSAHKFYGPKGTGALYINKEKKLKLYSQMLGGGQEKGIRSGTLNVPGIVGIGKASELCRLNLKDESKRIRNLQDKLYKGIIDNLDGVKLNGSFEKRLVNNLNMSFSYTKSENIMLNMRDVAVSTGAACSSASVKPSHVLKALGLTDEEIKSSVRFGVGRFNTEEEINYVINRVTETIKKLRESSPEYILNHKLSLS